MLKIFEFLSNSRYRFFIAWVFVMLCANAGLKHAYEYDDLSQKMHGSSIKIDWDTVDFTGEIQSKRNFVDTLQWWHGPWMEKVPYYRPLTITAFWTEYQIFGENGRIGFQWMHRLWHLAFLSLLLVFLKEIAGLRMATLSTGMFALGANAWFKLPEGVDAFNCWKDQCDIWSIMATTAACLSLWLWLASRQKSGTANQNQWWKEAGWWRTFGFFVLGLTIKETGLLAPLYLALTMWLAGKLWRHGLCLIPFFVGNVLWWGLRTWALHGRGHSTGSGDAWPARFASQAVGIPYSIIGGDGLTIFALGLVVGLVLLWFLRHDIKNRNLHYALGGWLLTMGLSLLMAVRYMPDTSLTDNLLRLTIITSWYEAFDLSLWLAGFGMMLWQLWKGEKLITFGWLWVVIGFLPFVIQPPTSSHVHYPLAPGWSLWLVACSLTFLKLVQKQIKARIKNNSRLQSA